MTRTRNQDSHDLHEGQQQSGSMDSVAQVLSIEQLNELTSRLTLEITQRILENPQQLLAQAKKPDDPRGLEESLRSLEVDKGYFGLSDIAKDSNALIKETKQMVHLAEFRKLSKDDSTPKERQWLELVAEHGKAQAVREDRIVAWVKYRLEPHMKVELRNLENQGVKCDTLEEVYNQLCVKFMCPETLDEVELQLRDIRQGKKEKFCDYFARLGAKEQKLYETCGRTELGKQRCSPEAQLMRLENGLDIDFAKFAREQVFRDNRTWPRTMTEASCILNYYDQTYRRFVCKAEKGSDTLLYSEGKNGKDKDTPLHQRPP